jgi:hypothetical protein
MVKKKRGRINCYIITCDACAIIDNTYINP